MRKPSDDLTICTEPKSLNRALERSHYLLPMTEDILYNLSWVKKKKCSLFEISKIGSGIPGQNSDPLFGRYHKI